MATCVTSPVRELKFKGKNVCRRGDSDCDPNLALEGTLKSSSRDLLKCVGFEEVWRGCCGVSMDLA